jgi:hypothetical protein
VHQIPDVLVGFDLSKRGHPAQPNSILNNPEQFAIGVLLYRRRCEIGSARIHPATGVSRRVPIEAMTCRAIGAVDLVSFFDARLQIGRCRGNTVVAASSNHDAFYSGREKGLEIAGLMKGVEFYLGDSHDHDDGTGRKNNQYNENPEPHLVDSALEAIQKLSEDRIQPRPAPVDLRCRFDVRNLNRIAGFVQGPGERSRFGLIIQQVIRLSGVIE